MAVTPPSTERIRELALASLRRVGVELPEPAAIPDGPVLTARTPITGGELFALAATDTAQAEQSIAEAAAAFTAWRITPAPARGELVRRFGDLLRAHKADLADLITIEAGKIRSEALGEVQEMIDICDFAVGLSRQLYGRTIASERPGHRLAETWHPL
jgi:aldehyde dehydrogenase (NAD+)